VTMSSRRTESRNLTGNGKVGGSRTSPKAVRRPVDHDTWVTGERNKREGNDCERTGDAEARTACGKESLSSLGKAASHHQRSYGEEGPDDRRSASKGEKEVFLYRLLLYIRNRFNYGPGILGNKALEDMTFIGQK
jgi:hypothetical protein